MKDVIIKIESIQSSETGNDKIELTTEGKLERIEGGFALHYNEGEMLGEKNVNTKLTAKGNKTFILERTGDMQSRLVIEKGVRNTCFYCVPQGELTLGIYGKALQNSITETGGKLKMVYTIDSNLKAISENTVKITVKEVKQ